MKEYEFVSSDGPQLNFDILSEIQVVQVDSSKFWPELPALTFMHVASLGKCTTIILVRT